MMEFLGNLSAGGYSLFGYILPFLLVLTIVVFFHELGHYLVAKWNDVDIEAFSIGFGRELIGFNDKAGTRWKLCAIPLGGYVKFAGDANAASVPDHEHLDTMSDKQKAGSFEHKRVGQRAAVVAAGPIANFILAIIIFTGSFYVYGRYISDPVVSTIVADSPAEAAGFLKGDIIKKVDGTEIEAFSDIPRIVGPKHGIEVVITVERDGKLLDVPVTPRLLEQEDRFGNVTSHGVIGITSRREDSNPRRVEYGLLESASLGVYETYYIIKRTFQYLGGIIVGRESSRQLSGPIGIAQVSGQVATLGWSALISLAAVLSVSIGLLNLFPVPLLDGGHLVFYAYEAVMGRKMSQKSQEYGFRLGFSLIICLMLFATYNDLVVNDRLGIVGWLQSLTI